MNIEQKISELATDINDKVSMIDVIAELEDCSTDMVAQLETVIADMKFNLNKIESRLADLHGRMMGKGDGE